MPAPITLTLTPALVVDRDLTQTHWIRRQITGPFYTALVTSEDSTWDAAYARQDLDIYSFERVHEEGQKPTLQLEIENPDVGLLSDGVDTWLWLSWYNPILAAIEPLFFGHTLALPEDPFQKIVTVTFVADPVDYEVQQRLEAESLKYFPNYSPGFLDDAHRDDPNSILEGHSRVYHVNPIAGPNSVSSSDVIEGEEATVDFQEDEIFEGSLTRRFSGAPVSAVVVDAGVNWTQRATGVIDLGSRTFFSYGGDGIVGDWPKKGAGLSGGWSVEDSLAIDVNGTAGAFSASWSFSWQNKEKNHHDGDTMSVSWSITQPVFSGTSIHVMLTSRVQTGALGVGVDQNGDPEPFNIPATINQTWTDVPLWQVKGYLQLRYKASRERKERIRFTLVADLQKVPGDNTFNSNIETITLEGGDVGSDLLSTTSSPLALLEWSSVAGQSVDIGQIIYVPASLDPLIVSSNFQVCVQAGTTSTTEPSFSLNMGTIVTDGTAKWAALGTSFSFELPNRPRNTLVPGGYLIRPIIDELSKGVWITLAGGTTADADSPTFAGDPGATVSDGSVTWLHLGSQVNYYGMPIGDPARRAYFPQPRGQEDIKYCLCVGRAHLLKAARCVEVSWECRAERVSALTLKGKARPFDPDLPSGQCIGKLTKVVMKGNGDTGEIIGEVTIGCTIGKETEISLDSGTPDYVEADCFEPGMQVIQGEIIGIASGDVGFSVPQDLPVDDGLTFTPLTKEQIIVTDIMHSENLGFQDALIHSAIAATAAVQNFGNPSSFQSALNLHALQLSAGKNTIGNALSKYPVWWELAIKPVAGQNFSQVFELETTHCKIAKQFDMEAS
jgi:hypothetical protein